MHNIGDSSREHCFGASLPSGRRKEPASTSEVAWQPPAHRGIGTRGRRLDALTPLLVIRISERFLGGGAPDTRHATADADSRLGGSRSKQKRYVRS